MSRSRLPLVLGLGAAGGIGFYLFRAGGNPRAAENKLESDAHRAAANVKARLPGNSPNTEKDLKNIGAEVGAKVDNAWAEVDKQAGRAKSNAEASYKDTKAEALKSVDKFDQKVEEGAAKAKGGMSSWFGSGNK